MRPDRLIRLMEVALEEHLRTGKPAHIPEPGRLVWRWFVELSATRSVTMAGPQPISHAETDAYFRLHRIEPGPLHLNMLRALDQVFLGNLRTAPATPERAAASVDLSTGIFDAMFG